MIEHPFEQRKVCPSYSTHTRPRKSRAYTRPVLVPTRADRPYGSFPRGHHDVAPDPGAQPAPQKTRIRTTLRRALPWTAALAAPALLVAISMAPAPRPEDVQPSATPTPAMSEVYAKVAPSVVQIKALRADGTLADTGSGVVIDDAGDILTALHVVQNAQRLTVVFADGTESSAAIISEVAESDIAALRPTNTPAQLPEVVFRQIDNLICTGLGHSGDLPDAFASGFGGARRPERIGGIRNLSRISCKTTVN